MLSGHTRATGGGGANSSASSTFHRIISNRASALSRNLSQTSAKQSIYDSLPSTKFVASVVTLVQHCLQDKKIYWSKAQLRASLKEQCQVIQRLNQLQDQLLDDAYGGLITRQMLEQSKLEHQFDPVYGHQLRLLQEGTITMMNDSLDGNIPILPWLTYPNVDKFAMLDLLRHFQDFEIEEICRLFKSAQNQNLNKHGGSQSSNHYGNGNLGGAIALDVVEFGNVLSSANIAAEREISLLTREPIETYYSSLGYYTKHCSDFAQIKTEMDQVHQDKLKNLFRPSMTTTMSNQQQQQQLNNLQQLQRQPQPQAQQIQQGHIVNHQQALQQQYQQQQQAAQFQFEQQQQIQQLQQQQQQYVMSGSQGYQVQQQQQYYQGPPPLEYYQFDQNTNLIHTKGAQNLNQPQQDLNQQPQQPTTVTSTQSQSQVQQQQQVQSQQQWQQLSQSLQQQSEGPNIGKITPKKMTSIDEDSLLVQQEHNHNINIDPISTLQSIQQQYKGAGHGQPGPVKFGPNIGNHAKGDQQQYYNQNQIYSQPPELSGTNMVAMSGPGGPSGPVQQSQNLKSALKPADKSGPYSGIVGPADQDSALKKGPDQKNVKIGPTTTMIRTNSDSNRKANDTMFGSGIVDHLSYYSRQYNEIHQIDSVSNKPDNCKNLENVNYEQQEQLEQNYQEGGGQLSMQDKDDISYRHHQQQITKSDSIRNVNGTTNKNQNQIQGQVQENSSITQSRDLYGEPQKQANPNKR